MKLIYEGADILAGVSVNQCIVEMYAEKRSDRIVIRFNDPQLKWGKWRPERGDVVELSEGPMSTGAMYVTSMQPTNGFYTLHAQAMPESMTAGTYKSWGEVKLKQLGQEVASRHGLAYESYGVTDRTYKYLAQRGEPDISFLQFRCQLEGCAVTVHDGKLVVYDEASMERQAPEETLRVSIDGVYEYSESQHDIYGSCKVVGGACSGEYADTSVGSSRVLIPPKVDLNDSDEALRFARNLLRLHNKYRCTGYMRRALMLGYAPATVLRIETAKAEEWNGDVFVTQVRHDFIRNETKLWFRRPLEGY